MPERPAKPNAFEMVRPRGMDRPSPLPARKGIGKPPLALPGSHVHVVDARGRLRPIDGPQTHLGFTIETRQQAIANQDRRSALVRGGI